MHLVVRMHPEDEVSDEEIIKRYKEYYGDDKYLAKEQVDEVRKRLCSLAAYVKGEIGDRHFLDFGSTPG